MGNKRFQNQMIIILVSLVLIGSMVMRLMD